LSVSTKICWPELFRVEQAKQLRPGLLINNWKIIIDHSSIINQGFLAEPGQKASNQIDSPAE
jgi:hypothetical protein